MAAAEGGFFWLGVVMADFAHRWIRVVLLALLGLTAMDQRALAFTAANNTVSQVSLGTCFVQRLVFRLPNLNPQTRLTCEVSQ